MAAGRQKPTERKDAMRIEEHPIIKDYGKGAKIAFTLDGKPMTGYEGDSIAAALHAEGVMTHRYTAKYGTPRGVFCCIGRCTDCVMIVNGQPNVRTCITPLEEGMKVETQYGVVNRAEWEAARPTATPKEA